MTYNKYNVRQGVRITSVFWEKLFCRVTPDTSIFQPGEHKLLEKQAERWHSNCLVLVTLTLSESYFPSTLWSFIISVYLLYVRTLLYLDLIPFCSISLHYLIASLFAVDSFSWPLPISFLTFPAMEYNFHFISGPDFEPVTPQLHVSWVTL